MNIHVPHHSAHPQCWVELSLCENEFHMNLLRKAVSFKVLFNYKWELLYLIHWRRSPCKEPDLKLVKTFQIKILRVSLLAQVLLTGEPPHANGGEGDIRKCAYHIWDFLVFLDKKPWFQTDLSWTKEEHYFFHETRAAYSPLAEVA